MRYLDFELEIGQGSAREGREGGREYPVAVLHSPAGEVRGVMRLPFDEAALAQQLDGLLALLTTGPAGGPAPAALAPAALAPERQVQALGQALFDALLSGEVRSLYHESRRTAAQQGQGLRLKLRIQPPELAALPWELLYDTRQAEHIGLSRHTPIVRYLELPQALQPLAVQAPLRILAMAASPSDLAPLDLAREKRWLDQAMAGLHGGGQVELVWLAGATARDLQRAMRAGPWHVFHFVGHGRFDAQNAEGAIALQDEAGQADFLDAAQLARLLADHDALRLVILNACEGAQASARDVFSSTAGTLVRRGLPAVLAMQYAISEEAAVEFARAFYEALVDAMPVDGAVAEARKAVSLQAANPVEWSIPVLFMRSPDGVLFDLPRQESAAPAAPAVPAAPAATAVHPPVPGAPAASAPRETAPAATADGAAARFMISYKRRAERDRALAEYLASFLGARGHSVFIDVSMRTGTAWLEEIDEQLKASDFLVVLVSEESADSEMVQAEVRRAYEYRKRQGRPQILPVRLKYQGLLPYALDAFLSQVQYVVWDGSADNERVAEELLAASSGQLPAREPVMPQRTAGTLTLSEDGRPLADAAAASVSRPLPQFDPRFLDDLEAPGGAVSLRDHFYVEREADARLKREILKTGTTITIRASRQTGKSSLLVRGIYHARRAERPAQVVYLDLQGVDAEKLVSADTFLYYLAGLMVRGLRLDPAELERAWHNALGPQDKLTYFLSDYLLPKGPPAIVLALDEVDLLLGTPFRNDFFALVRSWHNNRAMDELWEKLNVVMVISTEPYMLITDANQSPFNVGLKLYLEDFNEAQVRDLHERHGAPLQEHELAECLSLLGGHPYLTRKAFYTLVAEHMAWPELVRVAASDQGPFGDHLRRYHWLLRDEPALREAFRQIILRGGRSGEMAVFRLQRAGLVKGSGEAYACRCDLYRRYFKDRL